MGSNGTAMDVDAQPRVIALAAGSSHSVALLGGVKHRVLSRTIHLGQPPQRLCLHPRAAIADSDAVVTWGKGEDGQLGHGPAADSPTPRAVFALLGKGIDGICAGAEYTLALSQKETLIYSFGW